MSRQWILFALACVALSACSRSGPVSQSRSADDKGASASVGGGAGDYVVAAPVRHGKLTIFPVLSKTPRTDDRFMTLEEG